MSILAENAAEALESSYLEAGRFTAYGGADWEQQGCRCRKYRPGRSSGVSVFVEDAAEAVASSDVEVVELVWFGDWLGERTQGSRGAERAVGPVLVVEGLVLMQRVEKVGLVHDQGAVEEFGSARAHPAFHDRVHGKRRDKPVWRRRWKSSTSKG
jgi:hypothetical protein